MSREDSQFKLRIPTELREKLEKSAAEFKRSLNAEIVARLESSTFFGGPANELISAKKAKELAAEARKDLAGSLRQDVIEELGVSIVRGTGLCLVSLEAYHLEDMSESEFGEVVKGLEQELSTAGYEIEWNGQETLCIRFDS